MFSKDEILSESSWQDLIVRYKKPFNQKYYQTENYGKN